MQIPGGTVVEIAPVVVVEGKPVVEEKAHISSVCENRKEYESMLTRFFIKENNLTTLFIHMQQELFLANQL